MQQHNPKLLKKLSDMIPESTAHGSGEKFVFRSNDEMPNASTQVAFGHFKSGEVCEEHIHPTMYEYFFFISGEGLTKLTELNIRLNHIHFWKYRPAVNTPSMLIKIVTCILFTGV